MEIKTIPFADIVPDDYNPRRELRPGDVEFERIRNSIEQLGYIEPVVYNARTRHIVGGHQRVTAMQHIGRTEAAMSVVDIDEAEEKLLNLRLNRIKGRWDYDKLEPLLAGFSMEEALLTGFGSEELAVILAKGDDIDDYIDDFDDGDDAGADDDFDGASWVVTLKFPNHKAAVEWCEQRGFLGAAKPGKGTTVIRVEMD